MKVRQVFDILSIRDSFSLQDEFDRNVKNKGVECCHQNHDKV